MYIPGFKPSELNMSRKCIKGTFQGEYNGSVMAGVVKYCQQNGDKWDNVPFDYLFQFFPQDKISGINLPRMVVEIADIMTSNCKRLLSHDIRDITKMTVYPTEEGFNYLKKHYLCPMKKKKNGKKVVNKRSPRKK
jgi:hypothetical protein